MLKMLKRGQNNSFPIARKAILRCSIWLSGGSYFLLLFHLGSQRRAQSSVTSQSPWLALTGSSWRPVLCSSQHSTPLPSPVQARTEGTLNGCYLRCQLTYFKYYSFRKKPQGQIIPSAAFFPINLLPFNILWRESV